MWFQQIDQPIAQNGSIVPARGKAEAPADNDAWLREGFQESIGERRSDFNTFVAIEIDEEIRGGALRFSCLTYIQNRSMKQSMRHWQQFPYFRPQEVPNLRFFGVARASNEASN